MSTPIQDIIKEIKRSPALVPESKYNEWYIRLCNVMRQHGENRAQAVRNGYEMDDRFCRSINQDNEREISKLRAYISELETKIIARGGFVFKQP